MSRYSRWPSCSARFALRLGVAAYAFAALVVISMQGFIVLGPRECATTLTWAPLSAVPWLVVGLVPSLVYAGVLAFAARHRAPMTLGDGPYRATVLNAAVRIHHPRHHAYLNGLLMMLAFAAGVANSHRSSCDDSMWASCRANTSRIVVIDIW